MNKVMLYLLAGAGLLFFIPVLLLGIVFVCVRFIIFLFPLLLLIGALMAVYALSRIVGISGNRTEHTRYVYRK